MIPINEYVNTLVNARRYEIVEEKKLFLLDFGKKKKKSEEKPKIILTNEYVSQKVKENKITSISDILKFQYNKFDIVDLTGSLKNKNEKLILLYKDEPDYFIVYRISDKRTYYIELDYENGGTIEETGEEFITYYSNRITIPEEGLKVGSNGTLV